LILLHTQKKKVSFDMPIIDSIDERRNTIEHAWRVYLFYFFDIWQNVSIFISGMVYTPMGFLSISPALHIIVIVINLSFLQTVDMYNPSRSVENTLMRWEELATFNVPRIIKNLQKHEWINIMGMLHSFTAGFDTWLTIACFVSMYACFHVDYPYLRGHTLWVQKPCNRRSIDFGFVFAVVAVFSAYNLITIFTHLNLLNHYGKMQPISVIYVMSGIVVYNTVTCTIAYAQHMSLLLAYSDNVLTVVTISVLWVCELAGNIVATNAHPYDTGWFVFVVCVSSMNITMDIIVSGIGFSQFNAPHSGDAGHNDAACKFFGDEELHEKQYGDLIMLVVLRFIEVLTHTVALICVIIVYWSTTSTSSTGRLKSATLDIRDEVTRRETSSSQAQGGFHVSGTMRMRASRSGIAIV